MRGEILHHTHTHIHKTLKNLPFGRNAAEITKTESEIARDPLPVIAMLDTCLRLAALNHLETAMGWKCRHMRGGGRAQAGSLLSYWAALCCNDIQAYKIL